MWRDSMDKVDLHRLPIQPIHHRPNSIAKEKGKETQSFNEHLQQALHVGKLKISKHATERLAERNIQISEAEWSHIATKMEEAKGKGIRDSLILMEQAALIVSAKNATVITAMDRTEAKDQLFTNIDGTIVLS